MFEITADDIARLSDIDLRTLVGRLCEAELRRLGLPVSAVTWGGDQNAADGGLDVYVELDPGTAIAGFIPRAVTGFQVKAEDMPRGKILDEMKPGGLPRPVLADLAARSGAYVIVSSQGSTSYSALKNRRRAMKDAVEAVPNSSALSLDCYDRTRIATWVRDHPGIVLWVREKIGRAVEGWRGFGAWAYQAEGIGAEYLLDDKLRIRARTTGDSAEFGAVDGINHLRKSLRVPRNVARLVGLSGVGKTRFVQALFDTRIGEAALDPALAIYTNLADGPNPLPQAVATNLVSDGRRAILVIDNCQPELHRRLAGQCQAAGSLLSLITIEYDIREDQPEGTDVYLLEPSSKELIERLLAHRFPHLSFVDARTIGRLSDGNARVAVALAETVGKGENIVGMRDDDLFERLFRQGRPADDKLLQDAQAISLVYSFDGLDLSKSKTAELFRLAGLVDRSARELFRSVAELEARNLVQRRGKWRAVLPPAIANWLARSALREIPASDLESVLITHAPERLLLSFTRRLGYLVTCPDAEKIAKKLLGPNELLGGVADLSETRRAMFYNLAYVVPENALQALERGLLAQSEEYVRRCRGFVPLIRSLAYESKLFDRAVSLLLAIVRAAAQKDKESEAQKAFLSLFAIYFSGTHAPLEQRLKVVRSLLASDDPADHDLGVLALTSALEAWHFFGLYDFSFGSRSRDYGSQPGSRKDEEDWYHAVIGLAVEFACSDHPSALDVRRSLAKQFRGLWTKAAMYADLEGACARVRLKVFWFEGWSAVRHTLRFDGKGMSSDVRDRLLAIEERLRPGGLAEKVQSMVLSDALMDIGFDAEDDDDNDIGRTIARTEQAVEDLGRQISKTEGLLEGLLPDLLRSRSQSAFHFGRGLAAGAQNPAQLWGRLVNALQKIEPARRTIQVFGGFLNALQHSDVQTTRSLLDAAVEDEALALDFPHLQLSVTIDHLAADRLIRSLDVGKSPIHFYAALRGGRATDKLTGSQIRRLLLKIAEHVGGVEVALEILYMRLFSCATSGELCDPETLDTGRVLLRRLEFERSDPNFEHRLDLVIRHCLAGKDYAPIVYELCERLGRSQMDHETSISYHEDLLVSLFGVHPIAALEGLTSAAETDPEGELRIIREIGRLQNNPFYRIPDEQLLAWCEARPQTRYASIASVVPIIQPSNIPGRRKWSNIAIELIERAPDREAVINNLIGQFSPWSWVGSQAELLESNTNLLDDLSGHRDPLVRDFVQAEKIRLKSIVESYRQKEKAEAVERDERFE